MNVFKSTSHRLGITEPSHRFSPSGTCNDTFESTSFVGHTDFTQRPKTLAEASETSYLANISTTNDTNNHSHNLQKTHSELVSDFVIAQKKTDRFKNCKEMQEAVEIEENLFFGQKKIYIQSEKIEQKRDSLICMLYACFKLKPLSAIHLNYSNSMYDSSDITTTKNLNIIEFYNKKTTQLSDLLALPGKENVLASKKITSQLLFDKSFAEYISGSKECINSLLLILEKCSLDQHPKDRWDLPIEMNILPRLSVAVFILDDYIEKDIDSFNKIIIDLLTVKDLPIEEAAHCLELNKLDTPDSRLQLSATLANSLLKVALKKSIDLYDTITAKELTTPEHASSEPTHEELSSFQHTNFKIMILDIMAKKSHVMSLLPHTEDNHRRRVDLLRKASEICKSDYFDRFKLLKQDTPTISKFCSLYIELSFQINEIDEKELKDFNINLKSSWSYLMQAKIADEMDARTENENYLNTFNRNFVIQESPKDTFIVKRLPLSLTTSFLSTPTFLPLHFSNKRAENFTPEAFHVDNLESKHDKAVIPPILSILFDDIEIIRGSKKDPIEEKPQEATLLQQFSQLFHF